MRAEKNNPRQTPGVARLAVFSAIGFGIGGLLLPPAMVMAFGLGSSGALISPLAALGLGFAAQGSLGGTAIGLALRKGPRMTARLTVLGAIGFLVGGLLYAFLVAGGLFREVPPSRETGTEVWPLAVFVVAVTGLGFIANEAFREMGQGPASRKRRRIIAMVALFGAVGAVAGGGVLAFLRPAWTVPLFSSGALCLHGAVGGAVLGLSLKDRRKTIGLALASALGFWTGSVVFNYVQNLLGIEGPLLALLLVVRFPVQGIIGGAVLGAVMGYLEKQKAMQSDGKLLLEDHTSE